MAPRTRAAAAAPPSQMPGRARAAPRKSASRMAALTWGAVISWVLPAKAASRALSQRMLTRRVRPSEAAAICFSAAGEKTSGPLKPAARMRKPMYWAMSARTSGSSVKLWVMRSLSWRISLRLRMSFSSGWPKRTICSSLWRFDSRLESRRISSSVSAGMACASSMRTTTWRPCAYRSMRCSCRARSTALTRLVARLTCSSSARAKRISSRDSEGLARWIVTTCCGRRSISTRHSMVLPLPTSPLTLTMPSSWVMAYSSASSVAPRLAPSKKKSVCGVMRNGASVRPKCSRYMMRRFLPCYEVPEGASRSRSSTSMRLYSVVRLTPSSLAAWLTLPWLSLSAAWM